VTALELMQKRRLIVVASMLSTFFRRPRLRVCMANGKWAAAIHSDLGQIGPGATCLWASLRARASSGRASSTTAGPIAVSVSIGLLSGCPAISSPRQTLLLRMADDALYQASGEG